jgi:hypothetical protein
MAWALSDMAHAIASSVARKVVVLGIERLPDDACSYGACGAPVLAVSGGPEKSCEVEPKITEL